MATVSIHILGITTYASFSSVQIKADLWGLNNVLLRHAV